MKRSRKNERGYTAVEVMMAMTLLLIGSVGVMTMQQAAVQGNADAREMDVASSIARSWIERAQRDATLWTPSTVAIVPPANLQSALLVNENVTGQWFVPKSRLAASGSQNDIESAGFDMLGQDVDTMTASGLRYCVNLRITPLTLDQTLLRVEARVFWPRNLTVAPDANYCNQAPAAALDADTQKYHFVYAVGAVRQNVQP
ncbi:MAG TPA: prepilin-type N-terminal cleavage/methylation domain-containing protein [Polyangiaceae bacterium]